MSTELNVHDVTSIRTKIVYYPADNSIPYPFHCRHITLTRANGEEIVVKAFSKGATVIDSEQDE